MGHYRLSPPTQDLFQWKVITSGHNKLEKLSSSWRAKIDTEVVKTWNSLLQTNIPLTTTIPIETATDQCACFVIQSIPGLIMSEIPPSYLLV